MKSIRKAYRGEKGFTLVELLVVVVILGVLAAVATLAVTSFIVIGNVEAANTELHQAQTAIVVCMAEAGAAKLDAAVTEWNGTDTPAALTATSLNNAVYNAKDYIHRGTAFKATYNVDIYGNIISGTNVSWGNVTWGDNGWIKT